MLLRGLRHGTYEPLNLLHFETIVHRLGTASSQTAQTQGDVALLHTYAALSLRDYERSAGRWDRSGFAQRYHQVGECGR